MNKVLVKKWLENNRYGNWLLIVIFSLKKHNYPYSKCMVKNKVVFVHIPKCAGTSVLKMLGDSGKVRTHVPAYIFEDANPYRFRQYFKFSIVRNPWARVYSIYTYLSRGGNKTKDLEVFKDVASLEFKDFVMHWLTPEKVCSIKILQPQYFYIYDIQRGVYMVDYVGRLEGIDEAVRFIESIVGKKLSIEHENQSSNDDYRKNYDEVMKNRIQELYKLDCELLNYEF